MPIAGSVVARIGNNNDGGGERGNILRGRPQAPCNAGTRLFRQASTLAGHGNFMRCLEARRRQREQPAGKVPVIVVQGGPPSGWTPGRLDLPRLSSRLSPA